MGFIMSFLGSKQVRAKLQNHFPLLGEPPKGIQRKWCCLFDTVKSASSLVFQQVALQSLSNLCAACLQGYRIVCMTCSNCWDVTQKDWKHINVCRDSSGSCQICSIYSHLCNRKYWLAVSIRRGVTFIYLFVCFWCKSSILVSIYYMDIPIYIPYKIYCNTEF